MALFVLYEVWLDNNDCYFQSDCFIPNLKNRNVESVNLVTIQRLMAAQAGVKESDDKRPSVGASDFRQWARASNSLVGSIDTMYSLSLERLFSWTCFTVETTSTEHRPKQKSFQASDRLSSAMYLRRLDARECCLAILMNGNLGDITKIVIIYLCTNLRE